MASSFQTLRRLIANEVEPESWASGTTTAVGPTTAITASTWAMSGGDIRATDGGWVYFTDSSAGALEGQERAIAEAGLSVGGDITVGNAFSAVTPSGAGFEVHLRYPVTRAAGTPWVGSYRDMINDALRRLWFEDELSVSGVTAQPRYLIDITTYPWLADRPKDRILDVIGPADATTSVRTPTSQGWWIDDDAEAPAIIFEGGGFETGKTFYLKVARPCHTRIKINGVWTDVSDSSLNNGVAGLYADDDECHAIQSHVVAMAIAASMNHLGMRQPAIDKAAWEPRRLYWAGVASNIKYRRLPKKNDGHVRIPVAALGGGMMGRRYGRSRGWGGW